MKSKKKIVTVVGARPQFIKASAVSPLLKKGGLNEILVHTGQHYDYEMSQIFFEGLNLFTPHYNLGIGSHLHGKQTGLMLEGIENILLKEKPSLVIVYGDTNSTLAGALAASKLDIPVAHIEAGLRCYDTKMPEEINRRLSDHIASLLFAPTQTAVSNLEKEGIRKGVFLVGDVMYDVFLSNNSLFEKNKSKVLKKYGLKERRFAFVTLHRAENTQNKKRWSNIIKSLTLLSKKGLPIFWPAHPRTNALVRKINANDLQIVPPLSYLETQVLIGASKIVITDSGGIQKEAGFQKKTCLILRDRTEWVELVELGCAVLVDDDDEKIIEFSLMKNLQVKENLGKYFGDGMSSSKTVTEIKQFLKRK